MTSDLAHFYAVYFASAFLLAGLMLAAGWAVERRRDVRRRRFDAEFRRIVDTEYGEVGRR